MRNPQWLLFAWQVFNILFCGKFFNFRMTIQFIYSHTWYMNDLLPEEEVERPESNFRHWSLRMLMYYILLQMIMYYRVTHLAVPFTSKNLSGKNLSLFDIGMLIFSGLSWTLLITGITFTILSIARKEKRDYKYYISILGFGILLSAQIYFFISRGNALT